ncbi:MAG: hypothetical protein ACRDTE_33590 [Pseudonocardiaceae bacterium]
MSMSAAFGLGVLTWVVLSIMVALFLGRMIQLRERQCPDRAPPQERPPSDRAGAASPRQRSGWELRDET